MEIKIEIQAENPTPFIEWDNCPQYQLPISLPDIPQPILRDVSNRGSCSF